MFSLLYLNRNHKLMSQYNFWQSSVTDWLQAIGAIAVFYTLYLQYKSNLLQRKQLRISLIPKFELSTKENELFFNEKNPEGLEIEVHLKRNLAYNVHIDFLETGDAKIQKLEYHHDMSEGNSFTIQLAYPPESQPYMFVSDLSFDDSIGNRYIQRFSFFANKFSTDAPRKIKSINNG